MQTLTHEPADLPVPAPRRSRFSSRAAWWRYMRHLTEMVIAMLAGMLLLGVVGAAVGAAVGARGTVSDPLLGYAIMGLFMSVPMVAWMRRMGHTWADGGEMTAAMLVPTSALVLPSELGLELPGLTGHPLMALAHVAMIVGMAALMLYRWDRYTAATHCAGKRHDGAWYVPTAMSADPRVAPGTAHALPEPIVVATDLDLEARGRL